MKITAIISCFLLFSLMVHAGAVPVEYQLGPQLFRAGDGIQIKEVKATSPTFAVGETLVVTGTYALKSQAAARICIFVTQSEGDGRSEIMPGQQLEISAGTGEFELSLEIRHEGYLHVTFYPVARGRGFGGVYFGSSAKMKEIEDWALDWYLEDLHPSEQSSVLVPRAL